MTMESTIEQHAGLSLEEFSRRLRAWLAENMPRIDPVNPPRTPRDEESSWQRARELQKRLYDGGFAGICFPREVGGLGLDVAYQKAFNVAAADYELPLILNAPTFAICCATLLDTATAAQRTSHISAALRGDEVLVQLLSEPSGGSDLAGVTTRADRDGDSWRLNGAKTWSSSAFAADYGLCLTRTDWSLPKHQGLTMFLVPIHAPGITLRRIKQVSGSTEFCEEFFDDVELSDDLRIGEVNRGWDVATRLMFHERRGVGSGSEFSSGVGNEGAEAAQLDYHALIAKLGKSADRGVRASAGRALVYREVHRQLADHVFRQVRDGSLPPAAASFVRLSYAEAQTCNLDTALLISDTDSVVGGDEDILNLGRRFLSRQVSSLGGGSTEMARNVIGERILDFPRGYAADRGIPFNQVQHNSSR